MSGAGICLNVNFESSVAVNRAIYARDWNLEFVKVKSKFQIQIPNLSLPARPIGIKLRVLPNERTLMSDPAEAICQDRFCRQRRVLRRSGE